MLRKFGWRSWYSFWITKLFVADEGGEYALMNHIYKRFPLLLHEPFKIEMEHTTTCNKKCILCEHTYWKEPSRRITLSQFKRILDPLTHIRWINLTGEGSGFLNKDFIPMLEYLRSRHINVNFVDEFDFLDEAISRRIIELGINSIYISFDAATKETYEKIKKGCSFDRALKNIRTLLRLKQKMNSPFPVLHFRFVITTLNYEEMPQYIELIHGLKSRGVRARVEFVGLLSFPEIDQYYMPLDAIPEDILAETFENALTCDINLHFSHVGKHLPAMDACAAWTEPYILIGGEVISCCAIIMSNNRAFLRKNSFGNVSEKPFLEIWNSPRYRRFRKTVNNGSAPVPKTCYGCRAFDTECRARSSGIEA
ncbi:MAG: SPASM domain-containing protein [Deltaproteobacteria bacterium]|nr:SPASM domain-containing protein [Deltaproteobacteria bacterium]